MKDLSKWYVKNIAYTTLLFSLISFISDVIRGNEIDISYIMFSGIFIGILMGFFLGNMHVYEIKSLGISKLDSSTLDTIQEIYIKTNLSRSELVEKLKGQSTLNISGIDMKSDKIVISTTCNWKSFGEKIIIKLYSDNDGHSYHIVSRPKVRTTILDYGSNLNNILKIKSTLNIVPDASPQLG